MDWKLLGVIVTILTIQGGIILAAAKSVFVVRRQLYNANGLSHFITREELYLQEKEKSNEVSKLVEKIETILSILVPRSEWEASKNERTLRYTEQQENLYRRMDELVTSSLEMRKGQVEIGKAMAELQTCMKLIHSPISGTFDK